jgi:anti-sigma-K factor RskA
MDYSRPALADRLAAEYVLGTLRGPARRRLRSLLPAHPTLRRAVTRWRLRLMPLSISVPAVEPGPAVWAGIERRVFGASLPAARPEAAGSPPHSLDARLDTHPGGPASSSFEPTSQMHDSVDPAVARSSATPQPGRHPLDTPQGHNSHPAAIGGNAGKGRTGTRLWQCLAGLASLGALVLGLLLMEPVPVLAPLVIVLQANHAASATLPYPASFVASVSGDGRVLVLQPLDSVAINPRQTLELWALPPGGMGSPRSLGLVAAREATTVTGARLLSGTVGFAVSLEPAGGSSSGQPSGPILAIGKLSS